MKKYKIADFGVASNEEMLCTELIQKAVDTCHANGGGIIQFGVGRYVLSTVFLKSNITIEIP